MIDKKNVKILIIDDDESICKDTSYSLSREGFKVNYRTSAESGIDFLESNPDIDVISLDINLGHGINGVECLKRIKKIFKHIQVIMLTGEQGLNTGIECMRNGAYDYMTKPFNKEVFVEKALKAYERKLEMLKEEAEYLKTKDQVVKDTLTNLYNRRYLDDYMIDYMNTGWKYRSNLCLMVVDIDHFKNFNDKYGHQVGDEVLRHTANTLKASLRDADFVARYGGEEFVIILHDITLDNGNKVAEKIRSHVESSPLVYNNGSNEKSLPITVSIGITELKKDEYYKDLFKRADAALYAAKQNGRNRVVAEKV